MDRQPALQATDGASPMLDKVDATDLSHVTVAVTVTAEWLAEMEGGSGDGFQRRSGRSRDSRYHDSNASSRRHRVKN
ncbi:hypothetical protein FOPG_20010 [Fusarium oxysporum f. sp. conglutinans race 2 54008]|uniref:Uncharacterized protein n=1 Tax=Fusarium oxysporum f. sp. conglutinans race 2 54008 TaxID=1089457 RepID=X0GJ83_FUSOX|nr:hypothetical protein FOPG_20010 [Fusarium oxysporum f. sp. conglutinans race 2 54008]